MLFGLFGFLYKLIAHVKIIDRIKSHSAKHIIVGFVSGLMAYLLYASIISFFYSIKHPHTQFISCFTGFIMRYNIALAMAPSLGVMVALVKILAEKTNNKNFWRIVILGALLIDIYSMIYFMTPRHLEPESILSPILSLFQGGLMGALYCVGCKIRIIRRIDNKCFHSIVLGGFSGFLATIPFHLLNWDIFSYKMQEGFQVFMSYSSYLLYAHLLYTLASIILGIIMGWLVYKKKAITS